jgi:hypothetical protein
MAGVIISSYSIIVCSIIETYERHVWLHFFGNFLEVFSVLTPAIRNSRPVFLKMLIELAAILGYNGKNSRT